MLLLNAYAAALIVLRGRLWGVRVYRPMLVNTGLSLAPVLVALLLPLGLAGLVEVVAPLGADLSPLVVVVFWTFLAVTTAVWLLAFPNSAYLITELNMSHRRAGDPVPQWYDIVATLTLTVSGIANAVLGLGLIQLTALVLADADGLPAWSWLCVAVALVLAAFGVYLGRYVRSNSWDVRHPSSFVGKLAAHFGEAGSLSAAAGFVLTHALLLALVYVPVFVLAYRSLVG